MAKGCTICWSTPFASSWTTTMPAAASVPAPPRAISTEKAPGPGAHVWDEARQQRDQGDGPRERHTQHQRTDTTTTLVQAATTVPRK